MKKLENRKAFHDYEILERLEAGIVLLGPEVKSLREGNASLKESYAKPQNGEMFLYGMFIAPYPAAREKPAPRRVRKLLLHASQIRRWSKQVKENGLTIVPLSLYFNEQGRAKVELALVRGKTAGDKREALRKRQIQREIEQRLKRRG
ncbi:MAG: SsrA-binding protein SmpB [Candidatus Omnitrophica bacterium]|nr:SsrA-binding protein SmpB [Candidatus Omnitrophota bacterium]MCM8768499.1 SsrA-binding protein SmpB [Candidatus Omnitrophota bacterium]